MRAVRLFIAGAAAVALVPLAAGAASAAPPDNDEFTGAVAITFGTPVTEDTTEATLGTDDATLASNCLFVPPTYKSVWFQYTPAVSGGVAFDATASDYSTGLLVFEGTPSTNSLVSCNEGLAGAEMQAGQTYYVMAFADQADVGGNLALSVRNAPTPRAHLRLAKRGVAYHGGAARLHGTYTCRHDEGGAEVDAHLFQRAGRLKIQADNGVFPLRCNGVRHRWSLKMVSQVGTYVAGRSRASATITVCGVVTCTQAGDRHRVHLSWARSSRQSTGTPTAAPPRPRPLFTRHWYGRWA
jgi:hypothetical protein